MAIKQLSLSSVRPWQSKNDPDFGTPDATTFMIGVLDSHVLGQIKDMATSFKVDPSNPSDEVETTINRNEVNYHLAAYGIKDWKNFVGASGSQIAYKSVERRIAGSTYSMVDPELLKSIPQEIIAQIADEVTKDNEVSVAEGNA
jgi:hypothetical protein